MSMLLKIPESTFILVTIMFALAFIILFIPFDEAMHNAIENRVPKPFPKGKWTPEKILYTIKWSFWCLCFVTAIILCIYARLSR